VPHYVLISPLQQPLTYLLFATTWFSCIICIVISIHFFRLRRGAWWLVIALAMALPLLEEVGAALWIGLPPLPYSLEYPPQHMIDSAAGVAALDPSHGPVRSESIFVYSVSRVQWSFYPPMMAAALVWAYTRDKKERTG
jgi:hypothetical protein